MLVKVHNGKIKQLDEKGEGIAVIATLNVIDRDGDVAVPGAFGEQVVPMVPAHDWRQAPIGKVRIHEEGTEALADLQLNLKTDLGRNWYEALRFDFAHPPARQQYSYGYSIPKGGAETGEFNGQTARFLKSLQVHEVSPVLLGAGVDTRTVALKGLWLTVDQVKLMCPPCAEEMHARHITKIKLGELIKQGGFTCPKPFATLEECVERFGSEPDVDDPEAFCAAWEAACGERGKQEFTCPPPFATPEECVEQFRGDPEIDDPEAFCAAWEAACAEKMRKQTMVEQIAATVATVEATVRRLEKINDLRLKDGRDLSEMRKADIAGLVERLNRMLRGPSPKEVTQRYFDLKARTIKGLDPG